MVFLLGQKSVPRSEAFRLKPESLSQRSWRKRGNDDGMTDMHGRQPGNVPPKKNLRKNDDIRVGVAKWVSLVLQINTL